MRERFKFDAALFAIVQKEGKLLAIRRSQTGWLDGYWSLPAGAYDGKETFDAGTIRELREETGLNASKENCELVHVQQVFSDKSEWLALYIDVGDVEGVAQIMEPEKHDKLEWVDPASIPGAVVPYVKEALQHIEAGRRVSSFFLM